MHKAIVAALVCVMAIAAVALAQTPRVDGPGCGPDGDHCGPATTALLFSGDETSPRWATDLKPDLGKSPITFEARIKLFSGQDKRRHHVIMAQTADNGWGTSGVNRPITFLLGIRDRRVTFSPGMPKACAGAGEHHGATLTCPFGQTVFAEGRNAFGQCEPHQFVDTGFYGLQTDGCSDVGLGRNINIRGCYAFNYGHASERCCGKKSCTVDMTNGAHGDPCGGIVKQGHFVVMCELPSSTQQLNVNQWYHVGATYDGWTARIYVDGHLRGSFPFMQGQQAPVFQNTWHTPMQIGWSDAGLADRYLRPFNGMIRDLRIFKYAKSSGQMLSQRCLFSGGGAYLHARFSEGSGPTAQSSNGAIRYVGTGSPRWASLSQPCPSSQCVLYDPLKSSGCSCYSQDDPNVDDYCQTCRPSTDKYAWIREPNSCSASEACHPNGARNPLNNCEACDVSNNILDWSDFDHRGCSTSPGSCFNQSHCHFGECSDSFGLHKVRRGTTVPGLRPVSYSTIAQDFTVTTTNGAKLLRLGFFDSLTDSSGTFKVTVYDKSNGQIVAQETFTPSNPGRYIGQIRNGSPAVPSLGRTRVRDLPFPIDLAAGFRGVLVVEGYDSRHQVQLTETTFYDSSHCDELQEKQDHPELQLDRMIALGRVRVGSQINGYDDLSGLNFLHTPSRQFCSGTVSTVLSTFAKDFAREEPVRGWSYLTLAAGPGLPAGLKSTAYSPAVYTGPGAPGVDQNGKVTVAGYRFGQHGLLYSSSGTLENNAESSLVLVYRISLTDYAFPDEECTNSTVIAEEQVTVGNTTELQNVSRVVTTCAFPPVDTDNKPFRLIDLSIKAPNASITVTVSVDTTIIQQVTSPDASTLQSYNNSDLGNLQPNQRVIVHISGVGIAGNANGNALPFSDLDFAIARINPDGSRTVVGAFKDQFVPFTPRFPWTYRTGAPYLAPDRDAALQSGLIAFRALGFNTDSYLDDNAGIEVAKTMIRVRGDEVFLARAIGKGFEERALSGRVSFSCHLDAGASNVTTSESLTIRFLVDGVEQASRVFSCSGRNAQDAETHTWDAIMHTVAGGNVVYASLSAANDVPIKLVDWSYKLEIPVTRVTAPFFEVGEETGCTVDYKCYSAGDINPANECQTCEPSFSVTTWTIASNRVCSSCNEAKCVCSYGGECVPGEPDLGPPSNIVTDGLEPPPPPSCGDSCSASDTDETFFDSSPDNPLTPAASQCVKDVLAEFKAALHNPQFSLSLVFPSAEGQPDAIVYVTVSHAGPDATIANFLAHINGLDLVLPTVYKQEAYSKGRVSSFRVDVSYDATSEVCSHAVHEVASPIVADLALACVDIPPPRDSAILDEITDFANPFLQQFTGITDIFVDTGEQAGESGGEASDTVESGTYGTVDIEQAAIDTLESIKEYFLPGIDKAPPPVLNKGGQANLNVASGTMSLFGEAVIVGLNFDLELIVDYRDGVLHDVKTSASPKDGIPPAPTTMRNVDEDQTNNFNLASKIFSSGILWSLDRVDVTFKDNVELVWKPGAENTKLVVIRGTMVLEELELVLRSKTNGAVYREFDQCARVILVRGKHNVLGDVGVVEVSLANNILGAVNPNVPPPPTADVNPQLVAHATYDSLGLLTWATFFGDQAQSVVLQEALAVPVIGEAWSILLSGINSGGEAFTGTFIPFPINPPAGFAGSLPVPRAFLMKLAAEAGDGALEVVAGSLDSLSTEVYAAQAQVDNIVLSAFRALSKVILGLGEGLQDIMGGLFSASDWAVTTYSVILEFFGEDGEEARKIAEDIRKAAELSDGKATNVLNVADEVVQKLDHGLGATQVDASLLLSTSEYSPRANPALQWEKTTPSSFVYPGLTVRIAVGAVRRCFVNFDLYDERICPALVDFLGINPNGGSVTELTLFPVPGFRLASEFRDANPAIARILLGEKHDMRQIGLYFSNRRQLFPPFLLQTTIGAYFSAAMVPWPLQSNVVEWDADASFTLTPPFIGKVRIRQRGWYSFLTRFYVGDLLFAAELGPVFGPSLQVGCNILLGRDCILANGKRNPRARCTDAQGTIGFGPIFANFKVDGLTPKVAFEAWFGSSDSLPAWMFQFENTEPVILTFATDAVVDQRTGQNIAPGLTLIFNLKVFGVETQWELRYTFPSEMLRILQEFRGGTVFQPTGNPRAELDKALRRIERLALDVFMEATGVFAFRHPFEITPALKICRNLQCNPGEGPILRSLDYYLFGVLIYREWSGAASAILFPGTSVEFAREAEFFLSRFRSKVRFYEHGLGVRWLYEVTTEGLTFAGPLGNKLTAEVSLSSMGILADILAFFVDSVKFIAKLFTTPLRILGLLTAEEEAGLMECLNVEFRAFRFRGVWVPAMLGFGDEYEIDLRFKLLNYEVDYQARAVPGEMITNPVSFAGKMIDPVLDVVTVERPFIARAICDPSYDQIGALCYDKCRDGYERVAGSLLCFEKCPAGYTRVGQSCWKVHFKGANSKRISVGFGKKITIPCVGGCDSGYSTWGPCLCGRVSATAAPKIDFTRGFYPVYVPLYCPRGSLAFPQLEKHFPLPADAVPGCFDPCEDRSSPKSEIEEMAGDLEKKANGLFELGPRCFILSVLDCFFLVADIFGSLEGRINKLVATTEKLVDDSIAFATEIIMRPVREAEKAATATGNAFKGIF
eukprot:TRINITY_DN4250_c0_g1_i3.p1 TRINITY_DN4250_c0_g1~~TRINITY_DN4250_c0_g1_i3.p1  ORF type:complete len:2654 (+),score=488.00 TRINITY_DN4250_c0_g1_i3:579-8540(+)